MSNTEEDEQRHFDDETSSSTTSSSGMSEALRDDGVSEHAIASTWGYELYDEIVEFPPDVLSSLRNNLAPALSTIESATAGREDAAYHVERIDKRLAEIEEQIKQLNQEKNDLWTEAKPHRTKLRGFDAVLSPVRRLPFDLIREIARFTLPEHPSPSKRQSPLNLSQVSSSWRSAVLSLPQLWTTLYLTVEISDGWRRPARQIRGFFIHSQKKLFTLCLYFDDYYDESPTDEDLKSLAALLKNIAPIVRSISRLGIGAPNMSKIWDHLDLKKSGWDLRSLEHLHLLNHDQPMVTEDNTVISFAKSPRLSRLSTTGGFCSNPNLAVIYLIWNRLTNVRVTDALAFSNWRLLLDGCPQLRIGDFTIQFDSDDDISLIATRTFSHSALENLTFRAICDSFLSISFLSKFQMPSLQHLCLLSEESGTVANPSPPPPSDFASFSNIRKISIDDGWRNQPEYVTSVLHETVNLEELVFTSCPRSFSSIFQVMTVDPTSSAPPPLPNLRILRIMTSPLSRDKTGPRKNAYFYVDVLARLLASRRFSQVPPHFKALEEFFFCPRFSRRNASAVQTKMTNDLQEKLVLCKEEGMKIHCSNSEEDTGIFTPVHPFDTWMA